MAGAGRRVRARADAEGGFQPGQTLRRGGQAIGGAASTRRRRLGPFGGQRLLARSDATVPAWRQQEAGGDERRGEVRGGGR